MKSLDELVQELPPDKQQEVRDFAESLLREHDRPCQRRRLRLPWAGGLREYRDQYTSLELQKKALEWRGD
ncbi:MAG: DUF2281 domain-containing protein [Armatimonadetes bacterium]|nr:DUF2281 domain-containing protein [Armatimonadota bacterium]